MGHMGAVLGHAWAHTWATWEQQRGMHGRIHGPHGSSNGACIRAYMAIYRGIYGPHGSSNGAYMGAYIGHIGAAMGHAYAHTWAIYGGSNGVCMRAYMAIYGSPIGRAGRKGIVGNPFFPLVVPTPSLPLPSLLEGKGAGVIPFPSLPYSVA